MRLASFTDHGQAITLGEVVRHREQRLAIVACFRMDGGSCVLKPQCRVKPRLAAAQEAFMPKLARSTIADCGRVNPKTPRGMENAMTQIEFTGGMVHVDADVLAKAFRISTDDLRQSMRDGTITSRFERGEGEDAGKVRLTFYSSARRVRMTADDSGNVLTCSAADFSRRTPPIAHVTDAAGSAARGKTDMPDRGSEEADQLRRLDKLLDTALRETFPASDPIAVSFDAVGGARPAADTAER